MAVNSTGGFSAPMSPVQEAQIRAMADAFTSRGISPQITTAGYGGLAQGFAGLAQALTGQLLTKRADKGRQQRVDYLMQTFGQGVEPELQPIVRLLAENDSYGDLYNVARDTQDRRSRDSDLEWINSITNPGLPQTQPAGSGYQPGTIEASPLAPVSGYRGRLASLESGGDPMAKNPNSSATGRYQPIDSTWQQYMGDADRNDRHMQEEFLTKFTTDNANQMRPWLGRDPTDTEQYAAHRFGPKGARMLYTNQPDMSLENAIGPEAVAANQDLWAPDPAGKYQDKQGNRYRSKTVGEARSLLAENMPEGQTWANSGQATPDYSRIASALTGSGGQNAMAGGDQMQPSPTGGAAAQDWQTVAQNLNPIELAVIRGSDNPRAKLLEVVQGKMEAQAKETRDLQSRAVNLLNLLMPDGKTVQSFDANRQQDLIGTILRAGGREVSSDFQGGGQGGPFPGTSVEGQSLNIVHDYQTKKQRGEATTPQEDTAYRLAIARSSQVIVNQFTGEQFVYSPLTGAAVALDAQGQPAGDPFTVDNPDQLGEVSGTFNESSTVLEAAGEGTGFTAGLARWYQGTIGQIPGAPQADETVAASNAIRIINQNLKQALVNNPRFPVAEQEVVAKMLPDPDSLFTNPQDQQNKLRQLHEFIKTKMALNSRTLSIARISGDRRRELMDQNADMQTVVDLLQSLPVIGQAGGPDKPGVLKYGEDGARVR